MGFLRNLIIALLIGFPALVTAQVSLSSNVANFFTVFTDEKDSIDLVITNNTLTDYVVTDVDLYHDDAFQVGETAFTVPPGGSHTLRVYCDPLQNVRTEDWLLIKSSSHPVELSAFLFAFIRHSDPYYDLTFDLYHEDLKSALKTLISFGYTDLGYNPARDALFMQVDNQAANGQGAAQNTLECIYTGSTAVGYTNRLDCQNNYNFNTEHVFPQSLFNELQPMRSDIHHLMPVTASSNSERSNNPFGVVSNPNWTSGGSKSNGNTFEPRDAAKGDIARAMMYFVIRYQDFNNFMAPQEAVLRQWNKLFPPDSIDVTRNDLIQGFQNNRNPFVDHPEFCDRIASIATFNSGPTGPIAFHLSDSLNFQGTAQGDSAFGYFQIANFGPSDLQLSNFAFSNPDFSLQVQPVAAVPRDSARTIRVKFLPGSASNPSITGTLAFNTNDPAMSTVTVHLLGSSVVGRAEAATIPFQVYPQPASSRIAVSFDKSPLEPTLLKVYSLTGQLLQEKQWDGSGTVFELDLSQLPAGMYVLEVQSGDRMGRSRVVKH